MPNKSQQPNPEATPSPRGPGRPRKLTPEEEAQLIEFVKANPQATHDDMCAWIKARFGKSVDRATVAKCLKRHGIHKRRPPKAQTEAVQPGAKGAGKQAGTSESVPATDPKKRYGYRDYHRMEGGEDSYPSSLTDAEWAKVGHLFQHTGGGKTPDYDRRLLLDAMLYVVRGGVAWRMLPKEFPKWQNVYATFRRWTARDLFERMYDLLREMARERAGRRTEPTGAVLDSQSTRTSPQGGPKGYDAGKKVNGRKRHLLVDTLGLLLAVLITPASVQDRDAVAPILFEGKAKYPSICKTFVDGGYAGAKASAAAAAHSVILEVVRRPRDGNGTWTSPELPFEPAMSKPFPILPKRWVVERSNAWDERPRRMNRDHDRLLAVSTAWIWLLQGHMLLRQLVATA
jgi:transposase